MSSLPILLIFFDRPQLVPRILDSLRLIKPTHLYLACDGPIPNSADNLEKTQKCKTLLKNGITWKCEVFENYSSVNLGCDGWVPLAIDWFFTREECGIILEDDCLISSEFYRLCSELLLLYKDVPEVMNISAPNFQRKKWGDGDYYFSRYPSNWAWATWKRAWLQFDQKLLGLDDFLRAGGPFDSMEFNWCQKMYWKRFFLGLNSGKYTYWDAKWLYAIWKNKGLSITPNVNLSSNIGFGASATHTKDREWAHELPIENLPINIRHPSEYGFIQAFADNYLFKERYQPSLKGYFAKILNSFK